MNTEFPDDFVREAIHSALGDSPSNPGLAQKARRRLRDRGPRRKRSSYLIGALAAAIAVLFVGALVYQVAKNSRSSVSPSTSVTPPPTLTTLPSPATWRQSDQMGPGGPGPVVMAFDPETTEVIALANRRVLGDSSRDPLTYAWNGSDWRPINGAIPDLTVSAFAMAYDPASHQLIAVVQQGGAAFTWRWSGTSWIPLHPAAEPTGRGATSITYDPISRRLILFGGFNQSVGVLGDTWAWDGSTWTQLHPKVSPAPRLNAAMATDPRTARLLLVGGVGGTGLAAQRFPQTWTWDGGNWTQVQSANPIDINGYMSEGPGNDLLLFGGSNAQWQQWRWTGINWEAHLQGTTPPGLGAAAFDGASGQIVGLAPDRTGYEYSTWLFASGPALAPAALDLHGVHWKDIAVPGESCLTSGQIQLHGGTALIADPKHGNPNLPGGIGPRYDQLSDNPSAVIYGDLEGIGHAAAAVTLYCNNNGGTADGAILYSVAVFSGRTGELQLLGLITPQVQPTNVLPTLLAQPRISRGSITIDESWYATRDATCCPSGRATTTWTYSGGQLKPAR